MSRILVVIAVLAFCSEASAQRLFKGPVSQPVERKNPVKRPVADQFHLSHFQGVDGTVHLMAAVTNLGDRSDSSTKFSSVSSGPSRFVANYVFFDTTSDTAEAMFPHNDARVISMTSLSETTVLRDSGDGDRPIELVSMSEQGASNHHQRVRWHAVEFITDDTNGDGELTGLDRHRLAIADAAGRGLAEVIPNLGEVFSRKMIDADTFLVIHGSQEKQIAVRIDLPNRKIISSKPLPNFGTR